MDDAAPGDPAMDPMYAHLRDVLGRHDGPGTAGAAGCPTGGRRIDCVFVSAGVQSANAHVPRLGDEERSDHRPLVADLRVAARV